MERPQRHRRGVNHYSDDNPSTFTVKRRRGESFPPPPVSLEDNAAERRAARAQGRQRHRSSFPSQTTTTTTTTVWTNSSASTTTNGVTTPLKRGPGRPPNPHSKRRKRVPPNSSSKTTNGATSAKDDSKTSASSSSSSLTAVDQIVAHAVSIQPVLPLPLPERPTLAQRYPQIYQDLVATKGPSLPQWTRIAEAHKERWVPLQPQHAQLEEETSFLAVPAAPWTCFAVRQDDSNYFCVGDAAGQVLLYCRHPRAVCLQTVRTAAAQREAERPIAWSDTKHYTSTTTKAAAALYPNAVTAVCWQGAVCVVWTKREVQVLNVVHHTTLALVPLNDKGMPTTHSLAATTTATTGTKRHSPQQQALNFQALDLHPTQSLLLWRPLRCRPTEVPPPTTSNATFSHEYHSLFCIDFTVEPVTHTPVDPADSVSHCWCHAAVWDRHSPTHILTVLSQSSEDVSSSSWETWLCRMTVQGPVAQRTALPEAGRHVYTDCVLEQYHDFLFLCTGRGIRCYETNRLTFLTVYGETVALHNQTVAWQACFWIPEPGFDAGELVLGSSGSNSSTGGGTSKNHRQATTCWIHRSDELASTSSSVQARAGGLRRWESTSSAHSHSTTSSAGMPASHPSTNQNNNTNGNKLFSNMLLVGVPHPTRGPTELQSTLYVWKPGQVLPLTTLQAPPGGLLGLHIMATPGRGWNLVCATAHSGHGWQWSATVQSEFAGTPYPVGYQLVTESVEYVEDETELDHNVWVAQPPQQQQPTTSPTTKQEDSDLQKALQQSLQQQEQEPLISVLCSDDDDENDTVVRVPSVPEPSLREVFDTQAAAAAVSPGRRRPPHSQRRVRSTPQALTLFPQCSKAMQEQQEHQPKQPPQQPQQVVATSQQQHRTVASEQQPPTLKGKGKRSRIATVEALLLSAVNPVLKEKMSLVHKEWKSTTTCRAPPNDETTTVFRCAACQGRMVVHTCGKRELPVDTEALERAEKLRQEQEAAEQKRLRAERRRLAEAKRRESRRKKKELEDRRLYAQRMEEERRIRATLEQEEQDRQHQAEQQRQAAVLRLVAAAAPPMVASSSSSSPRVVVEPVSQQRLAVAAEYSHYQQQQQQQQLPTAAAAVSVVSSSSSNSTTAAARPSIPKFSELRNCHSASTTLSSSSSSSQQTQGYSSSSTPHGFYATAATPASEPVFAATTTTTTDAPPTASSATTTATGAYYQQSESTAEAAHAAAAMANARRDLTTTFTASDRDALAALVGLAESLAPQRPSNNTTPTTTSHYDYSGSSDRRSAILAQYSSWKPPTVTYEHPTTTTTNTNTASSSLSAAPNAVRFVPHHHHQQEGASTPTTTTTTSRSVSEGASKEAVSAAYSAFGTTTTTQPSLWSRGSSATTTTDPADATTTTPWNATTTTTTTNGVDPAKEY